MEEERRDEAGREPEQDRVERARTALERAEAADDGTRLQALEEVRRDLEEELETSVENGPPRH